MALVPVVQKPLPVLGLDLLLRYEIEVLGQQPEKDVNYTLVTV